MDSFNSSKDPAGLGDVIAKITHRLGLAKMAQDIAHLVGKEDCGCDRRREQLNDLIPFQTEEKKEEDSNNAT